MFSPLSLHAEVNDPSLTFLQLRYEAILLAKRLNLPISTRFVGTSYLFLPSDPCPLREEAYPAKPLPLDPTPAEVSWESA